MKTKELIQQLQELDPEGKLDICSDNASIYTIVRIPAFEDGCLERLEFDDQQEVNSAEITTEGDKIELVFLPILDALTIYPDIPVKLSVHNNLLLEHYSSLLQEWKEGAIHLHEIFKESVQKERES